MKIRLNKELNVDVACCDKITLDDNIIFFQCDEKVEAININEVNCIKNFYERHNDWECEVVDHIVELVADDFFSILENEYKEEKTIDLDKTIEQILKFYLPEEFRGES